MRISFETPQGSVYPHIINFPDGQLLLNEPLKDSYPICTVSITSAEELLAVAQVVQRTVIKELHIAYLYGMRSDRPFTPNQPHYLRDVLGPIFSNMISPFVKSIYLYTPHSEVAIGVIPKAEKRDVMPELIAEYGMTENNYTLVLPDAGAEKRWKGLFNQVQIVQCAKEREEDGRPKVRLLSQPEHKNILVIDDLCDGGATFKTIAEALPEGSIPTLAVAHFLCGNNWVENLKAYKEIIVSNSFYSSRLDPKDSKITCLDLFNI